MYRWTRFRTSNTNVISVEPKSSVEPKGNEIISKNEAIRIFGEDVVERARDFYETDFGKVLFQEDCVEEFDFPLNNNDAILSYLFAAKNE